VDGSFEKKPGQEPETVHSSAAAKMGQGWRTTLWNDSAADIVFPNRPHAWIDVDDPRFTNAVGVRARGLWPEFTTQERATSGRRFRAAKSGLDRAGAR
jgi:hypothetical protein